MDIRAEFRRVRDEIAQAVKMLTIELLALGRRVDLLERTKQNVKPKRKT